MNRRVCGLQLGYLKSQPPLPVAAPSSNDENTLMVLLASKRGTYVSNIQHGGELKGTESQATYSWAIPCLAKGPAEAAGAAVAVVVWLSLCPGFAASGGRVGVCMALTEAMTSFKREATLCRKTRRTAVPSVVPNALN